MNFKDRGKEGKYCGREEDICYYEDNYGDPTKGYNPNIDRFYYDGFKEDLDYFMAASKIVGEFGDIVKGGDPKIWNEQGGTMMWANEHIMAARQGLQYQMRKGEPYSSVYTGVTYTANWLREDLDPVVEEIKKRLTILKPPEAKV